MSTYTLRTSVAAKFVVKYWSMRSPSPQPSGYSARLWLASLACRGEGKSLSLQSELASRSRHCAEFFVAARPYALTENYYSLSCYECLLWAHLRPRVVISGGLLSSSRFLKRTNSRIILNCRHSYGHYLLGLTAHSGRQTPDNILSGRLPFN